MGKGEECGTAFRSCVCLTQEHTSMKETAISLSERTFILEALKKANRIDGRRVQDIRTVRIAFREQYGSAEVQYGKTRYWPYVLLLVVSCMTT